LQGLCLVRRQTQLSYRRTCRADDGRLGEAAGRNTRSQAFVEREHLGQHHDRDKPADSHDRRHDDLANGFPSERTEELRTAFKTNGIDEECKQHSLDAIVDRDADLTDCDCNEEGTGDTAKGEFSELEFPDPVTASQSQK